MNKTGSSFFKLFGIITMIAVLVMVGVFAVIAYVKQTIEQTINFTYVASGSVVAEIQYSEKKTNDVYYSILEDATITFDGNETTDVQKGAAITPVLDVKLDNDKNELLSEERTYAYLIEIFNDANVNCEHPNLKISFSKHPVLTLNAKKHSIIVQANGNEVSDITEEGYIIAPEGILSIEVIITINPLYSATSEEGIDISLGQISLEATKQAPTEDDQSEAA